jgi:hypothetical protein
VLAGGLAGLAGLSGAVLAGCSGDGTRPPSPAGASTAARAAAADDAAVGRARTAAAQFAAAAEELARAGGAPARLLADVAADHRAHLAALGGPAPSPTPGTGPSASGGSPAPERLGVLARDESTGAQAALDDAMAASPMVAALLARIAAARAAHADLLSAAAGLRLPGRLVPAGVAVGIPAAAPGPDAAAPGPTPSPSAALPLPPPPVGVQPSPAAPPSPSAGVAVLAAGAREALVALTAGEHAAVFAYGLVAARVPGPQRARARAGWSWHLERRDQLEERLLTAGVEPPVAAPAYDVGGAPTPAGAVRLAATVEQRLAALTVRAVSATQGDDRREAAAALVEAARRTAAWTGRPQALPG